MKLLYNKWLNPLPKSSHIVSLMFHCEYAPLSLMFDDESAPTAFSFESWTLLRHALLFRCQSDQRPMLGQDDFDSELKSLRDVAEYMRRAELFYCTSLDVLAVTARMVSESAASFWASDKKA